MCLAQCLYSHALCARAHHPTGIINDTFETAITCERFESFPDRVKAATERSIVEATGRPGEVTFRCTHGIPTGRRHTSLHAAGRHSESSAQWHTIKPRLMP